VIGWIILYSYPQIRTLALGCLRSTVATNGDANLASLRVPRGWQAEGGVCERPTIQIANAFNGSYVTITSESKEDLDLDLDLESYARQIHEWFASTGGIVELRGPEPSRIGDFPAVVFEVDRLYEHHVLRYLHVAIDGRRARHQALAWTTRLRFNRRRFAAVLAGFSETPGPDPRHPAADACGGRRTATVAVRRAFIGQHRGTRETLARVVRQTLCKVRGPNLPSPMSSADRRSGGPKTAGQRSPQLRSNAADWSHAVHHAEIHRGRTWGCPPAL